MRRRRSAVLAVHRFALPLIVADWLLATGTYWIAYRLRFDAGVSPRFAELYDATKFLAGTCVVLALLALGAYRRRWRASGSSDDLRAGQAAILGVLAFLALNAVLQPVTVAGAGGLSTLYPPTGVLGIWLVACSLGLVGARMLVRVAFEQPAIAFRAQRDARAALIVGAGDGGRLVLRELQRNPELGLRPAGFVDDDPAKQGGKVDGVRVVGRVEDLPRLLEEVRPDEVLIAIPSAPGTLRASVVRAGREAGIPVRTLPTVFELLQAGEGTAVRQVREVRVEDVLGREPVRMALGDAAGYLRGRRVLVTGAGGSIGSELCRQIARVEPAELLLLDHAEDNLFRIERELLEDRHVPTDRLSSVIADVKEGERLREVVGAHAPEVVFHAAAYKHVGLMQTNPVEAFRNNAIATRQLARICGEAGVERFVLVSTDKAVDPATVMGASKALAELAVETAAQRWPQTRWASVRFGNVLGSSGSVVPIFRRQIALGGPVTVTDERMTRFFMTIPEAVQLVIRAGGVGGGGRILTLDMGEPVSIMQLARDMIELSGLRPEEDIAIEVVGTRPGEKLHEELVNGFEVVEPSGVDRVHLAARTPFPPEVVEAMFDEIGLLVLEGDAAGLAEAVTRLQRAHVERDAASPAGDGPPPAVAPPARERTDGRGTTSAARST